MPIISKRKLPADNPEQSKRFIEMAQEVGAGETQEPLERILKKAKRPKLHLPSFKDS